MLENKFCKVPFENLEISTMRDDGSVPCHTCCFNWLPEVAGDLKSQSLDKVWNSHKMQQIRTSILDGSFKYCSREFCPEIQANTLPLKSEVKSPRLRDIIDNDRVVLEDAPKIINMAMDNTCNLACPSCRPEKIVNSLEKQKEILELYHETVTKNINDIEELFCCSSGDPFASKVYRTFLSELDLHHNPHLKIQINTNGVLFDERAWNDIKNIHLNISQVLISLDAAREETYRVVRKGGDFKRVLKNIKFLVSLKEKGYLPYIRLDFVVQRENYREIPEFIKLGKKLKVDNVYFQKINDWGTFPEDEFKDHAIYLKEHPEYDHFIEILKGEETFDPIVKPGNLADFIPQHHLNVIQHDINKRKIEKILSEKEGSSIDSFWARIHQKNILNKRIIRSLSFELSALEQKDSFFTSLSRELEEGSSISVIEHWNSPLNRFLSRKENIDKSFIKQLFLSSALNQLVHKNELSIENYHYIMPFEFLFIQRKLSHLTFFGRFLDLIFKPVAPWLALHCSFLVQKKSSLKLRD